MWGHRGASVARRENTIAAFVEARRQGADGVELDVRRCADGALVVHHDAALPGSGPIASLRVGELPPDVPLLDEALDACAGLTVDVEIKNVPTDPDYDPTDSIAAAVAALVAPWGDRVLVTSFNLRTIDAVKGAEPGVLTGWLTPDYFDQERARRDVAARGHDAILPFHTAVTAALVADAHGAGLAVHAWTVDEPDRVLALARAGVDAVITNVPDVARRVLDGLPG